MVAVQVSDARTRPARARGKMRRVGRGALVRDHACARIDGRKCLGALFAGGAAMTDRILIVDDDADQCSLLESMLARLGYAADATTSAHDALERAAQVRYSAILTDLQMGEMSGLALCEQLVATAPEVPII